MLGMVLLLGCVSTSLAAVGPITFSEYPIGTVVDDEYASLGVLFAAGYAGNLPQIRMDGAMPGSPVVIGIPYGIGDFWMEFIQPVESVGFDCGYWDVVGSGVIELYAPDNSLITVASNSITGPESVSYAGLGAIKKIRFDGSADPAGASLDNLTFTPVPEPGTLLLLSLGGTAVFASRRRRRK